MLKKTCLLLLFTAKVLLGKTQPMQYVSCAAEPVINTVRADNIMPFIRIIITTIGTGNPLSALQFQLASPLSKISSGNCRLYYTGTSDSFFTNSLFATLQWSKHMQISGGQTLQEGTNYFWLAADVSKNLSQKIPKTTFISCTTGVQEYEQAWADEFNMDGPPNPANWHFEKGFVRNNELQWYQTNNAVCKNGILTIEARRETVSNPEFNPAIRDWRTRREQAYYTSSSINTSGLQTWQYGRFELRAKIDTNAGCWPAWWTLGVDGRWPHNGEIDIMEFYKGNILANYAVGTERSYVAKWFSTSTPVAAFNKPAWADRFHNWRMDWDSAGIRIYLDDSLLSYQPQAVLYNRSGNNSTYPFRQKHYMLLNLAIGGDNGGDNGGDPSRTIFPRKYEIDYVRVWQKIKGKYSSQTIHTIGN